MQFKIIVMVFEYTIDAKDSLEVKLAREYNEIRWDEITHLKSILKELLDYWHLHNQSNSKDFAMKIEADTQWHKFIYEVFSGYHPDWTTKLKGDRISFFYVAMTDMGTPCIHFKLSNHDFSSDDHLGFSKLRKSYGEKYWLSQVKECCRNAIYSDKKRFGEQAAYQLSKFGHLQEAEEYVIHHDNLSFDDIVMSWIKIKGLKKLIHFVNPTVGGGTLTEFTSPTLKEEFRKFHKEKASLKYITVNEHKKIHGHK